MSDHMEDNVYELQVATVIGDAREVIKAWHVETAGKPNGGISADGIGYLDLALLSLSHAIGVLDRGGIDDTDPDVIE